MLEDVFGQEFKGMFKYFKRKLTPTPKRVKIRRKHLSKKGKN